MKVLATALLILSLEAASCASQHSDEPEVAATLEKTIAALQHADFDALWSLTDPDAQAELLALVRQIHAALQQVPEVYGALGATQQAAARAALGESLVDAIFPDEPRAGAKLLARLLSPAEMRFDDHAMDGVSHREITVDTTHEPIQALVHTTAGETFAFVRTAGGWRSRLVRDVILDSGAIRTARDNIAKVEAAAAAQREAWRRSRDPQAPQGAYNLARGAQTEQPANAKLLYTLLDDDARAALVDVLQNSREAQREVQKRTTRKQRRKAYEEAGLDLYVDMKSDRDLFVHWARLPSWVAPLAAIDDPMSIDGDLSTGRVDVITISNGRVTMVRAADGSWRIRGHAPAITRVLGAKLAASDAP